MNMKKDVGVLAATGSLVGAVGLMFALAWVLMLSLGGLHTSWPAIPALGFGATVLLMLVTAILFRDKSSLTSKE